MGGMNPLTRLDEAVLPRLARGLVRVRGGLRRWRMRPLTAVALALVLAVVVTTLFRLGEPDPRPGTRPYDRVGVTDGSLVSEYIAASQLELDRLLLGPDASQPVYALVSFTQYQDAAGVAALAATAGPLLDTVVALARAPIPRRQTEVVRLGADRLPDDIYAAMPEVSKRKTVAAGRSRERAAAQPTPSSRADLESLAEVEEAEAAAFANPRCRCVFALVVRGAPAVLKRLAAAKGVRVIDPAPEVTSPATTTFVGLLPEQTGRVQPPPDDALNRTTR